MVLTAAAVGFLSVGTGMPSAMDITCGGVKEVTGRRTFAVKVESRGK